MKLDEAIERYTSNAEYERTHGNLQGFLEFKQLAKWLRDYKRLLEREPALDKVRAEIGMYEADCRLQGGTNECEKCNSNIFGSIYRIIDKYKSDSEVQDGIDIS